MTKTTRKVPSEIIEYLKKVFDLLEQEYTVSEDNSSFTSSLSDEDWEHSVKDAYAFLERDEMKSPFPVITAYTAENPERLAKFGASQDEGFIIYSQDQDEILL